MTASYRRPIAARNHAWAKAAAARLGERGVTPNMISMAGTGAAALAFLVLWWAGAVSHGLARAPLFLLAAGFILARMVCNLLDGMVAIEGARGAPDGAFWNEFTDRISDILILGGLGLAAHHPGLGFLAAALAVLAAYVRELGRARGAPVDFGGPLAKPERMVTAMVGLGLAMLWPLWGADPWWVLRVVLWVIILGTAATVALRAARLIQWMKARPPGAAVPPD